MSEATKTESKGDFITALREQVDREVTELHPQPIRAVSSLKDRTDLESILIDVMGMARSSMDFTEEENQALIKLEAQRLRTADIYAFREQRGLKVTPQTLKRFLKTVEEDAEAAGRENPDMVLTKNRKREPLTPDTVRKHAMKALNAVEDGNIGEALDEETINPLMRAATSLNDWRTRKLLGNERAAEYAERRDLAVAVYMKTNHLLDKHDQPVDLKTG